MTNIQQCHVRPASLHVRGDLEPDGTRAVPTDPNSIVHHRLAFATTNDETVMVDVSSSDLSQSIGYQVDGRKTPLPDWTETALVVGPRRKHGPAFPRVTRRRLVVIDPNSRGSQVDLHTEITVVGRHSLDARLPDGQLLPLNQRWIRFSHPIPADFSGVLTVGVQVC